MRLEATRSAFTSISPLGKAFEDARQWAESFDHYARRECTCACAGHRTDREDVATEVTRSIDLFDRHFFAARAGVRRSGARSDLHHRHAARRIDPDRTDIVEPPADRRHLGTARHSATRARPRRGSLARRSGHLPCRHRRRCRPRPLPTSAGNISRRLRIVARPAGRSSSTSCPNNWLHIGFIHLILPNARIVDARREPMACCFSNFKQHFARGQNFAYSLADLGSYYRDYVRLTDAFRRGTARPDPPRAA